MVTMKELEQRIEAIENRLKPRVERKITYKKCHRWCISGKRAWHLRR